MPKLSKSKQIKDKKSNSSLTVGKLSCKKCPKAERKIALVCDWLTTPGGAEKVLLELHHMYPDAPIYTSQYNRKGIDWFDDATVKTGWLQIFPSSLRKVLGPLRQFYFSRLDLSDYDIVISVTGAEAKSVRTHSTSKQGKKRNKNNSSSETALFDEESNQSLEVRHLSLRKGSNRTKTQQLQAKRSISPLYHSTSNLSISTVETVEKQAYHLCYCHVPTQYYWQMYDKYLENPGFGFLNPIVKFLFKLLVKPLRHADFEAAQRPDQFVTISGYAQEQIQKYYHRDAAIVAPPVEVNKFIPKNHTFPQDNPPKSTSFPQNKRELSTKPTKLSTKNQKISTKTSEISTESSNLSTNKPSFSTTARVLFHKFSTEKQKKSTKTSIFSTTNPDLSTTYPQLIHSEGTTFPPKSETSPQETRTFPQDFHSQTSSFPQYHYQPNQPNQTPEIIYPNPPAYYIIACRQVTWKRVDLAISACQQLGLPLLVIGDGPERQNLINLTLDGTMTHGKTHYTSNNSKTHNTSSNPKTHSASDDSDVCDTPDDSSIPNHTPSSTPDDTNIKFLPWMQTDELAGYLQHAKGYIFPSLEPFGIAAVEALAAGCPVIAYKDGGSRDFIHDQINGIFFDQQTPASLIKALRRFEKLHFDRAAVSETAVKFSPQHFRQGITQLIDQHLTKEQPEEVSTHPTSTATTPPEPTPHLSAKPKLSHKKGINNS